MIGLTTRVDLAPGHRRSAATFVPIPYPYDRNKEKHDPDLAVTVLGTFRMPLECFPDVDLGAIETIGFSVGEQALLAFDDIELTH